MADINPQAPAKRDARPSRAAQREARLAGAVQRDRAARAGRTTPVGEAPESDRMRQMAGRSSPLLDQAADKALIELVELLFFAYRDFTGEADAALAEFDFGRAHHRVLHFVNRRPGLRVADLLDILCITKQSLARVLKELVDRGFIVQEAGHADRRERHLFLTQNGQELAVKLARLQKARIEQALSTASVGREDVKAFLIGIVGARHRAWVEQVVSGDPMDVIGATLDQDGSAVRARGRADSQGH